MNNNNWKQIKAVLMTYYTRPLILVVIGICLLAVILSSVMLYTAENLHIQNRSIQNIMGQLIMIEIYFTIVFVLLFFQIKIQFSLPQSRIYPQYRGNHLSVAGYSVLMIVFIFSFPLWAAGVSIDKSLGFISGILMIYSCFMLDKKFQTHFPLYLSAIIFLPYILFSFLPKGRIFENGLEGGLHWYFIDSFLFPYFLIITGCISLYFAGKAVSSAENYVLLKESNLDFSSYYNLIKSLNKKNQTNQTKKTFFGFSNEHKFSIPVNLDLSRWKYRIQLWKIGSPPSPKFFGFMFLVMYLIMVEFVFPVRNSNVGNKVLQTTMLFPFILNLIIVRYAHQSQSLYSQIEKSTLSFIKPFDKKIIVQDLLFLFCSKSVVSIFIDSIVITVMVFWRVQNISIATYLSVVLLSFSLLLFPKSISIYWIKSKYRIFLYGLVLLLEVIAVSLINLNELHVGLAPFFIVLISFTLITLSAVIIYFAYHRWQNMEWGAKG